MEFPLGLPPSEDEVSEVTQAHAEAGGGDPEEEEEEEVGCDEEETPESRERKKAKKGPDPMKKTWSKGDGLWRDEVKGESSARNNGDDNAKRGGESGDRTALAALTAQLLMFDKVPKGMDSGFLSEIKRSSAMLKFDKVPEGMDSGFLSEIQRSSAIGVDEEFLSAGLALIERKKRVELEDKWRKLQMAELATLSERAGFIRLTMEAILETSESRKR